MLERSSANPILTPQPDVAWCSQKVYNPAVTYDGETYTMLFRAVGNDWISRLGFATSLDGVSFTASAEPIMKPQRPWEAMGCEDPRLSRLGQRYYLSYTAFDGQTARAALAHSLPGWQANPRPTVADDWSKSAALFPQMIGKRYWLYFGDSQVWAASSDDLNHWDVLKTPVLSRRAGSFDAGYVEMGPPPILTKRGWLVLYHGIDRADAERTYALGAALFAHDDPLKLLWRSTHPLLTPSEAYETSSLIDVIDGGFATLKTLSLIDREALAHQHRLPKAVFCCSALLQNGRLRLYYGAGDTVIGLAEVDLEAVFSL
jgi:predicted GH43/DUF377 family glycosyl hydrolase